MADRTMVAKKTKVLKGAWAFFQEVLNRFAKKNVEIKIRTRKYLFEV